MNTQTKPSERATIITALYNWIAQRPGLDFANYGDVSAYRSELRSITKDLNHARQLIRAVELSSISATAIKSAFSRAFSGRLQWQEEAKCEGCGATFWSDYNRAPGAFHGQCKCSTAGQFVNRPLTGRGRLDYCTGQYWPTEYRRAVCAVMASALWEHTREHCMPKKKDGPGGPALYDGKTAGDFIRARFRKEFGRGIASRWFQ
jgi:hypothetical protein